MASYLQFISFILCGASALWSFAQPGGGGGSVPLCNKRLSGGEDTRIQNHSCATLPCDHPDMIWSDEVPTSQTCGRATQNTNVSDCGTEVAYQRLINLYRGGR